MEAMICKQCGAPLKDNKCEHCGTEYHEQIIHNHYTTVINNFGMPLKEKVKEEPFPTHEESGAVAEGLGAFAIIGLFVGFIVCICAACV